MEIEQNMTKILFNLRNEIFILKFLFLNSDEDKLKWAFKLYDVDNNGTIDVKEMEAIIDTLDSIEGVKPGTELLRSRICN